MAIVFKKPGVSPDSLFSISEKSRTTGVEGRVKMIMDRVPEARSDDRWLFRMYLDEFHRITTFQQYCDNKNCPTIENLRRTRQKIQSKEK